MNWLKRISLFLILNFLILLTISTIIRFFNIQPFLTRHGINYEALLIFCLLWGMGGAFISLMLSKKIAQWFMGIRLIDPHADPMSNRLYSIVVKQARSLNIKVPDVGIFESPLPNAFATGPSSSNALVAISTGLLNRMNESEIEAVIGHEMSHIANGDMVTMTLLQGIINAFVMFLARILAFFFASGRDRNQTSFGAYYFLTFVFEIIFMLLGSIVICAFSRFREYRADRGGALLAGKENMINALRSLQRISDENHQYSRRSQDQPAAIQALFINRSNGSILFQLFSTHPTIEKRIQRLKEGV
ncbi:MAG: protease HtpX [Simkaniaceae bacterium]|nr:protease HtpX [Simkaniaceae bacterium]